MSAADKPHCLPPTSPNVCCRQVPPNVCRESSPLLRRTMSTPPSASPPIGTGACCRASPSYMRPYMWPTGAMHHGARLSQGGQGRAGQGRRQQGRAEYGKAEQGRPEN
eukprot:7437255-Alexandrium_andersonii.AAC.1